MRAKLNQWPVLLAVSVLLIGATILGSGCSQPGMVLHTDPLPPYVTYYDESPGASVAPLPGQPPVYYDYEFYPDWNVYYYPADGTYYWAENGHWRSGHRLPPRYTIGQARHERVHSPSLQPWGSGAKPDEVPDWP